MKTRVRTYPEEIKQEEDGGQSSIFTIFDFFLFILFTPILVTIIWIALSSQYKIFYICMSIIAPFIIIYYRNYALLYTFKEGKSNTKLNLNNLTHHNNFLNNSEIQSQGLRYLNWKLRYNSILKLIRYTCYYSVALFIAIIFLGGIFISNTFLFSLTLVFAIGIITVPLVSTILDEVGNYRREKITEENSRLLFRKIHSKVFLYQKESKKSRNKATLIFY